MVPPQTDAPLLVKNDSSLIWPYGNFSQIYLEADLSIPCGVDFDVLRLIRNLFVLGFDTNG